MDAPPASSFPVRLLASLLAVALTSGTSFAQGLIPSDPEALKRLPVFNPSQVAVKTVAAPPGEPTQTYTETVFVGAKAIPASIDLSAGFPEPGNQGRMSSCVGWAVSRAITAQVAHYRRTKSFDGKHDTFCPYFIYNQLNGGQDGGCLIYSDRENQACAVKLVTRKGCCSTATMGLANASFTAQPEDKARNEAANYRVYDHRLVPSLEDIKQALAQQYPIVLGICTDPDFHALRGAKVYQWSGVAPNGQPHGRHAVCLVGYDDARKAVRLLNSWGTGWGDQGYAWIGYDNLKTLGPTSWCFEAHLLRVMDHDLPQYVTVPKTNTQYYLDDKKSLYQVGKPQRLAGPDFAERIAVTADWMYGITGDGGVVTLAKIVNGGFVSDKPRDITTPAWPEGLTKNNARPEITMIACSDKYAFALSRDGHLFRRLPSPPQRVPVWQEIPYTQPGDRNIDLRNHGNVVTVTKQSGRVRIWDSGREVWNDYTPESIQPVAMPLLRP